MNNFRPSSGIVHLGLGAFFRAFGCVYVSEAMAQSGGDWGIIGVSLRSPKTRDALKSQNWSYTSVTLGPDGNTCQKINVLNDILVAPEEPNAVLRAMAEPAVKIVSMTITEKGYCHNPATGSLNHDHPEIQHDLNHALPVSAIGFLVRALQMRRAAGLAPFTVLSCDNLPENGRLVRGVVLELAQLMDPDLHDWIASNGKFPSTMVDRITPATTDDDIVRVEQMIDYHDAWPVMHEPFSQWAVEDNFVQGERPDLAAAGVELVHDVKAHEHMKLRMLNGTHSALAYTGYLAGHETIASAMADPVFEDYAKLLWSQIMPAIDAPPGVDLTDYADALLNRYKNPGIRHKTWQIAMDGSQKLPQRILGTVRENIHSDRSSSGLLLAIAAWMHYVGGVDEKGHEIDVQDPLSGTLRMLSNSAGTPAEKVLALLSVQEIFPEDLIELIQDRMIIAVERISSLGAREAVRELVIKG